MNKDKVAMVTRIGSKQGASRSSSFDASAMDSSDGGGKRPRFRLARTPLSRRSQPAGIDAEDPSCGSQSSGEGNRSGFRMARYRLRGRTQSMPLEDVPSEPVEMKRDAESLTMGRQRFPLMMWT